MNVCRFLYKLNVILHHVIAQLCTAIFKIIMFTCITKTDAYKYLTRKQIVLLFKSP